MQSKKPHPKYCHCHQRHVTSHIALGPAGSCWEDEFVTYCLVCKLMGWVPQFFVIERECLVDRVPRGAVAFLSLRSRPEGVTELSFATGTGTKAMILSVQPYDRRPEAMGVNPNDVLLVTWNRLDEFTKWLMHGNEDRDPADLLTGKAKARAYAEVLSTMMVPFFDNPDDIVREAIRRWENRDNPDYETPGLGVKSLAEFEYKPIVKTISGPKPTGNTIPLEALDSVKQAIELKMFTVKQIADSYSMTDREVKSQLGLA